MHCFHLGKGYSRFLYSKSHYKFSHGNISCKDKFFVGSANTDCERLEKNGSWNSMGGVKFCRISVQLPRFCERLGSTGRVLCTVELPLPPGIGSRVCKAIMSAAGFAFR